MRIFLFELFLWHTSLIESWPKLVRLVLLAFNFIQFYQFHQFYVSLGDIWCCLICFIFCLHICSCMHVLTTRFLTHAYDLDLSIQMCLSMYAIWHSHHHSLGCIWQPWIRMSRFWSAKHSRTFWGDQSGIMVAWLTPVTLSSQPFSWSDLETPLVVRDHFSAFDYVYFIVNHTFILWRCNILVIMYHSLW